MRTAITRLLLGMGLLVPLLSLGRAADAQQVRCPFISWGATEDCYTARDVAVAEDQLSVAPVNPASAVWSFAHLPLTSEIVWRATFHPEIADAMDYIFGAIPRNWDGWMPSPSPFNPPFLIVAEDPGIPAGPWRIYRTKNLPLNGKPQYAWNFYSSRVRIEGDLPKEAIRDIGLAALR